MKKLIFTCLALAAITSACTKSEVVETPNIDTPITFEAYSGRIPVAKATSIDNKADLDEFVVYGFTTTKSGEGNSVTYTPDYSSNGQYLNQTVKYYAASGSASDGWKFKSDDVYYWPADGNELAFVAYSKNVDENAYSNNTTPSLAVSVANTVADQKDIMVADFEQCGAGTKGVVQLDFKHILSRIHFSVVADRDLTIYSVKIFGSFKSEGTVDLTAQSVKITASTEQSASVESYEFISDTENGITVDADANGKSIDNTPDSTEEDHYMMIIPAEATKIEIEYMFNDDPSNTKYVATADLGSDFEFAAGKSYLYVLTLTSQKVSFDVNFNEWDTDTETASSTVSFTIEKNSLLTY